MPSTIPGPAPPTVPLTVPLGRPQSGEPSRPEYRFTSTRWRRLLCGNAGALLLILGWGLLWWAMMWRSAGFSWRFFVTAGTALLHPDVPCGGWHVYACHPELQFGPLTLLASAAAQLLPTAVVLPSATLLMMLTAPALLAVLARQRLAVTGLPVRPLTFLTTGFLLVPVWALLCVHYAHLDDVLALAAVSLATVALRRAWYSGATLALTASVLAKPWAIGFATLLLLIPAARRRRCMLIFAGLVGAAWIPFFVVDPGTARLAQFTISTAPSSALRALGFHDATTPAWDRPAQLVLGVAVAALLVRRGRWTWVPLAVVASRLLLDPQVYGYYSTGLVLAAVIADLTPRHRSHLWSAKPSPPWKQLPWWTVCCAAWSLLDLVAPAVIDNLAKAELRLVAMGALLAVMVVGASLKRQPRLAMGAP